MFYGACIKAHSVWIKQFHTTGIGSCGIYTYALVVTDTHWDRMLDFCVYLALVVRMLYIGSSFQSSRENNNAFGYPTEIILICKPVLFYQQTQSNQFTSKELVSCISVQWLAHIFCECTHFSTAQVTAARAPL